MEWRSKLMIPLSISPWTMRRDVMPKQGELGALIATPKGHEIIAIRRAGCFDAVALRQALLGCAAGDRRAMRC